MKIIAAVAAMGAAVALAAPAQADYRFYQCSPTVGVASQVTSCAFAQNVANAYPYSVTAYGVVLRGVYSPVTGQFYDMYCNPGTVTYFSGFTVNSEICEGGNNARVAVL